MRCTELVVVALNHSKCNTRSRSIVINPAPTYGARMLTAIVSPPPYDRLVELHLQLRIPFERSRQVRLAGDGVEQLVQLGARAVTQDQHEVAGLRGRERKPRARRSDADGAAVAHDFPQLRHVTVGAVVLPRQHRHIPALHPVERQAADRDRRQLRVNRQPLRAANAAALDEGEVTVGLHADEERRVRHDRARSARRRCGRLRLRRRGRAGSGDTRVRRSASDRD